VTVVLFDVGGDAVLDARMAEDPGSVTPLLKASGAESKCSGFGGLSLDQATIVLIHEPLHHARMEEAPSYEGARTSRAIDVLVYGRCGFFYREAHLKGSSQTRQWLEHLCCSRPARGPENPPPIEC